MAKAFSKKPRSTFTRTECAVILALHRTAPVKGCHSGRGGMHNEACFRTCYASWQMAANDIALLLSFARPELDKYKFVEACKTLPREVSKVTDKLWVPRLQSEREQRDKEAVSV